MIHVVPLDVRKPSHATLTPILAQRIEEFARDHDETVDPVQMSRQVMARLWSGDPDLLVVALLSEDGRVVGHGLAQIQDNGPKILVLVQAKADENVGDAAKEGHRLMEQWGQSRGALLSMAVIHRNPDAWRRRFGEEYKIARTVLVRKFQGKEVS